MQRLLVGSAAVTLLGLALVGLGPSTLGASLTLAGAVTLLYAIHRYGRLGSDQARPRAE